MKLSTIESDIRAIVLKTIREGNDAGLKEAIKRGKAIKPKIAATNGRK